MPRTISKVKLEQHYEDCKEICLPRRDWRKKTYRTSMEGRPDNKIYTFSRSDSQCPTATEAVSDCRNATKHSSSLNFSFETGGECKLFLSRSKGQPLICLHGQDSLEQQCRLSKSALKHLITPSRNSSEASIGESNAPRINFFVNTMNCKNKPWVLENSPYQTSTNNSSGRLTKRLSKQNIQL